MLNNVYFYIPLQIYIMKIAFISMWRTFNDHNNWYLTLLNKQFDGMTVVDPTNCDILFIGSFIKQSDINIFDKLLCKKILIVTEPITIKSHKPTYELYINNYFDMVFGSVSNNTEINHVKYPLYMCYFEYTDSKLFTNINKPIPSNYCCLINSHDSFATRTKIHNTASKYGIVTCPGKLLNNYSNRKLNKTGKVPWMKNYIFNICPENTLSVKGYVTEKLLDSCLANCIPIYYGNIDDIDKQIFNMERVLFCDPFDQTSIDNLDKKLNHLMNDHDKLCSLYNLPVWCDNAYDVLQSLETNLIHAIKLLL